MHMRLLRSDILKRRANVNRRTRPPGFPSYPNAGHHHTFVHHTQMLPQLARAMHIKPPFNAECAAAPAWVPQQPPRATRL